MSLQIIPDMECRLGDTLRVPKPDSYTPMTDTQLSETLAAIARDEIPEYAQIKYNHVTLTKEASSDKEVPKNAIYVKSANGYLYGFIKENL